MLQETKTENQISHTKHFNLVRTMREMALIAYSRKIEMEFSQMMAYSVLCIQHTRDVRWHIVYVDVIF